MCTKTIDYYNENAKKFIDSTVNVEFSRIQKKFLDCLKRGDFILDFGCGSGRDSKAFLEQGYRVEAIDGSEELCRLASSYIGQEVKQMLFQELNETEKYDGIWACSSILHLERKDLIDVMKKMNKAVKTGGYVYVSFKYGAFSGIRNGRYFIDMTEESFKACLAEAGEYRIIDTEVTADARPGREDEKWLNVIVQKL